MKDEILYQIVEVDSDLIKGCPDKVTFISQREDMNDGILYNDYDFKNHRYIRSYVSDNFNIYDRLEEKDKQLDKYKNVIDKIKELIERKLSTETYQHLKKLYDDIDSTEEIWEDYEFEDLLDILELLEEVE